MSEPGHYVKGSARGSYPGRIVSVNVETQPVDIHGKRSSRVRHTFKRAFATWTYRKRNCYSSPQSATFGTAAAFWEWLERQYNRSCRVIVIAPIASDALTLLQFWDRLTSMGATWIGKKSSGTNASGKTSGETGYAIKRLVLRGKPDIVEYRLAAGGYLWVSGIQYLDMDNDAIAAAVDYQWSPLSDPGEADSALAWTPREVSRLWLAAAVKLAEWWAPLKAGPFPRTVGSAASAFMRSRGGVKGLCTHKNATAARLERLACHGGRCSVFDFRHFSPRASGDSTDDLPFPPSPYGAARGPLYQYDYSSMYPRIMRDERFPTKHMGCSDEIPLSELRDLCGAFCCIAHVTLTSEVAEYPHRYASRVIFPTGTYTTTLTTPEIVQALQEGSVRTVHGVSCYAAGRPYVRAASELIDMRQRERDAGNAGWELFTKLLSNSMTGRLAMRSGQWVARPDAPPPVDWGEWIEDEPRSGPPTRFRARAGLVEQLVRDESGPGTLTAGYAHITGYGRLMMRRLREWLPARSVVAQDTDGIWVTGQAKAVIESSRLAGSAPVPLPRLVKSARLVRFWTAKHYCIDGRWVASGLSAPEFVLGSSRFNDSYTRNEVHSGTDAPPRSILRISRAGSLELNVTDCLVTPGGRAAPIRLPLLPGRKPDIPDPEENHGLF